MSRTKGTQKTDKMENLNSSIISQETIVQKGRSLKSFVEELITTNGAVLVNMSNLKFSGVEASNINLHGINLYGSEFSNAFVQCANFIGANLEKVIFRQTNLSGACFRGANLDNTVFAESNLTNADFRGLSGERAHRVTLFCGSDLKGANFSGLTLKRPDFTGCDMRGVDMSRCNITGGNFTNANLQYANLMGGSFNNSIFVNANLMHANMFGVNLFGTNIEGANIEGLCMPIICGCKSIKTDYNQRVILMNFILHWMAGCDNITNIEKEVYKIAVKYADDSLFNDCVANMNKINPVSATPTSSAYVYVNNLDAEIESK